jgi:hypothetical protein
MNLSRLCQIGAAGTALLFQVQIFAAAHPCPPSGQPTERSQTWNFKHEGFGLLRDIGREARDVRTEAAKLRVQAQYLNVSWQSQALELDQIRGDINDMGKKLCRLETIREELAPEQRVIVNQSAPLLKEMAIFAQDSIVFANAHQGDFWSPMYRAYVKNLNTEADALAHAVKGLREGSCSPALKTCR